MNPVACPCKKVKCERHGNCEACRAYHAASKRKRPCYCEREKYIRHTRIKELFHKEGKNIDS